MAHVNNRAEIREFLTTRRAKITPAQAGIPADGPRRVPGLRRGEVASLAGVSIEYYSKIERGDLTGVSAPVLEAIARALQLDMAEREHLLHLAQASGAAPHLTRSRRHAERAWTPRPALQRALDAIVESPAIVGNGRGDFLAANLLGRAMYADMLAGGGAQPNFYRFTFLDSASRRFYPQWTLFADTSVSVLRAETGRNPEDRQLFELIGELSTHSDEFRRRWNAHDVRIHTTGIKHFHHAAVGDLTLSYETFDLTTEPGLGLTIYTAEPSSPTAQALRLLSSWAKTEVLESGLAG